MLKYVLWEVKIRRRRLINKGWEGIRRKKTWMFEYHPETKANNFRYIGFENHPVRIYNGTHKMQRMFSEVISYISDGICHDVFHFYFIFTEKSLYICNIK